MAAASKSLGKRKARVDDEHGEQPKSIRRVLNENSFQDQFDDQNFLEQGLTGVENYAVETVPESIIDSVDSKGRFERKSFEKSLLGRTPLQYRSQIKQFMYESISHTSKNTKDLEQAFTQFVQELGSINRQDIRHVVRPSGILTSPLAIKLHYPTYTVKDANGGQTLDESSSCIRILLRKGLSDAVFWYETYFVRETPGNDACGARLIPSDAYTVQEKACHGRFRDVCEEYASFRVVLLAGVPAGKGFKEKYKPKSGKIDELDVWLHLVVRSGKITRIGVSMPHPEAFLRALSGKVRLPYKVAARLDNAINVAVTLAGIDLEIAERYFSAFLLDRYSGPETVLDFDESPMSALMEGRRKEIDTGTKISFQDLPLSVIRYVTKERKLNSLEDVEDALRPTKPEDSYLLNAHRIMHAKSYETRKVRASSKRSESSVPFERTTQTKSDMSISTVCEGCSKYAVVDTSPVFGTEGPVKDIYITRSTERCPTGCSNPKPGKKSALRLDLIPVDKSIAYMSQKRFRALVQAAKKAQEKAAKKTIKA